MADLCDKLTIIHTKGTFDWLYPPLILGSTAAALGKDVDMFCTFYGLNLLLKDTSKIKVTPVGNPAMPMKFPFGPAWLQNFDWAPKVPNLIWNMPFVDNFATLMMKMTCKKNGVAEVEELREMCIEAEVNFLACQMTVELFGYNEDQFIDGVEFVGAATYFDLSNETSTTQSLFI
jgi:peroxiredoxin family protein